MNQAVKRISVFFTALSVFISTFFSVPLIANLSVNAAGDTTPIKVTLSMPSDPKTSRNFTWHTADPCASDLEIIEATSGMTADEADFSGANVKKYTGTTVGTLYSNQVHRAKATGLTPGKRHFFRVGDAANNSWSRVGSFVTDNGDDSFQFIYVADLQSGASAAKNSIYTMKKALEVAPSAEFIMNVGDFINQPYKGDAEWLAGLGTDGFPIYGNLTSLVTAGNHDYQADSGNNEPPVENALSYHFYHDVAPTCYSGSGVYYSVNYGNVHIVSINTNDYWFGNISEDQLEWIKKDLESEAAKNADFRIVMMHRGIYTPGPHYYSYCDINQLTHQLTSVMADYNIDLVFQGHDHVYGLTKQIDREGNASNSLVSYIWDEVTGKYVEAMKDNKNPVYFIGGTAGTKYEPVLEWDKAKSTYIIPATDSAGLGKYNKNIGSDDVIKEYLSKFIKTVSPSNSEGRNQAMFNIVSVKGKQLVVDTYTVDNQIQGDMAYYSSFALDKSEQSITVKPEDTVKPPTSSSDSSSKQNSTSPSTISAANSVYAKQSPAIDGNSDDTSWADTSYFNISRLSKDFDTATVSAKAKSIWNSDGLYFLVDVTDPTKGTYTSDKPRNNDCVEFLLDWNNSKLTARDKDDYFVRLFRDATANDGIAAGGGGGEFNHEEYRKSIKYAVKETKNGYTMEVFFPTPEKTSLILDRTVGFDMQIIDQSSNKKIESIIAFCDTTNNGIADQSLAGDLKLTGGADAPTVPTVFKDEEISEDTENSDSSTHKDTIDSETKSSKAPIVLIIIIVSVVAIAGSVAAGLIIFKKTSAKK